MDKRAVRVDVTATLFQDPEWQTVLEGIKAAAKQEKVQLGIQLHNTSYALDIERAAATGLPLTAHIPLVSDWQINFAARDMGPSLQSLHDSVRLMRHYGIEKGVVHGFVMTDQAIPSFGRGRSYDDGMKAVYRPELSLGASRICRDFSALPEYFERRERVKERLEWLRREFPDVEIYMENDFPTYGAANLFADGALALDHDICLDSSHLWASAHIFDRDYYREVDAFNVTGRVKMVHLHASVCPADTPKTEWTDGHRPLAVDTPMDLQRFVRSCRNGGVRHYVLEIKGVSAADIICFGELWRGAAS